MPNIAEFISHGTQFETVYTPLARTYPSWSSILTGVFPSKHGAVYNLIAQEYLNSNVTNLAQIYKEQGYQS